MFEYGWEILRGTCERLAARGMKMQRIVKSYGDLINTWPGCLQLVGVSEFIGMLRSHFFSHDVHDLIWFWPPL